MTEHEALEDEPVLTLPPILWEGYHQRDEWLVLDRHGRALPASAESAAVHAGAGCCRRFVRTVTYGSWSEVTTSAAPAPRGLTPQERADIDAADDDD